MSNVTNVIFSFSILEDCVEEAASDPFLIMESIEAWLLKHANGQSFGPELGPQSECYGGRKALETPLFVAAFNYFPDEDFLAFLATLPWREPGEVQLMVQRQEEERFTVLTLADAEDMKEG